ncbi:DUF4911 domain-containing protein [Candidatus Desantisbacteria bacterium]|nr:DUF4911 domain-containing protein [Candidatus Desantisbacteria bacterium]
MQVETLNTISKCYKVPSEKIGFINMIIDSYEGMACLRTLDEKLGYVELWISPFFEKEVEKIIEDLKKDILIERI